MADMKAEMEKIVAEFTKSDPRYLQARVTREEVASDGAHVFVLLEQIDLRADGQFGDAQYRWSIWLMKPGDTNFAQVHEEHAYVSRRELFLRLVQEDGKIKGQDEEDRTVWSYDLTGETA